MELTASRSDLQKELYMGVAIGPNSALQRTSARSHVCCFPVLGGGPEAAELGTLGVAATIMAHEASLPEQDEPPVLSLGAFRLRPLQASDAVHWSAYLSDPRVTLHTSWGSTDLATIEQLIHRLRADYATKASWRWAIARELDDCLVGVCGFSSWSTVHRAAELVYDLSPEYWSRGIVTSSVQAVVGWGFSNAGLNRVQAVVLPSNGPSIVVLNRCGFTQEGLLRQYRIVRGEPRDFLLYSRLRTQPHRSRRDA